MRPVDPCGLKRALLINDLSCFGKCSLSVSLPILSAYGVEAVPLPTAVLSPHTSGFTGYASMDMTEALRRFPAHWAQLGLRFDCIAVGYCTSAEQLRLAAALIRSLADEHTLVVVDPVLGDQGALYPGLKEAQVEAMRELCSLARWITPNRTEAALLAGLPASAGDRTLLQALQTENTVITSIQRENTIGFLARLGGQEVLLQQERLPLTPLGAGDVFTSALCGELLSGKGPREALERAAGFCHRCIQETAKRQPGHWYGLAFEPALKGIWYE